MFFINVEEAQLLSYFPESLHHEWCCLYLSSAFSVSIYMIVWFFFSFSLLIWWITLIDFQNWASLTWGNPHLHGWDFWILLLLNSVCWGLLEIYITAFMRDITSEVLFWFWFWYCIFYHWYQVILTFIKWWKVSFLFSGRDYVNFYVW